MSVLLGPSAKQLEMIQSELNENEDRLENNIRDLKIWCASQPHLPDITDEQLLRVFLRGCRHDVMRTRNKIECFCRARAHSSDLYQLRHVNNKQIQNILSHLDIVILPRLTEDGCRITVFRFKIAPEEMTFSIADIVQYVFLLVDVRMHDEHALAGDVFLWDLGNTPAAVAARAVAAANVLRRAMYLAHTAYPQRLKRVYLLNTAPFLASLITLIRSFLKEKIKNRFMMLSSLEMLHEHISRDVLPADLGGLEADLATLVHRWNQRITDLQPYLNNLDNLRAKGEKPHSNGFNNDVSLFGTEGAFRSLNID